MTLKTRRLIYGLFILIFLISAPILVLYAAGYRYNFKKNKFQQTGAFFLETLPKDAAIFLEDKPYPDKTTTQISKLLPGDYLIKLTKENYYDWQKKLPIYAETVTFVKEVILFKKNIAPLRLIEKPILASLPAPDNQKIISVVLNEQQQELWLTNLIRATTNRLELTYQPKDQFELIAWAPSNKKILVKKTNEKQTDYLVINAEKPEEMISLSDFTALTKSPKQIKWDLTNDNYLYAQVASIIYKINLATQAVETLKIKTNNDFLLVNDFFYYLPEKDGAIYLTRQSLAKPNEPEYIIKLPDAKNYIFLASLPNLIILNDLNQNLLVVELNKKDIILEAKAKNISWSTDQQELLYDNDLEIWLYRLASQEKELITRYSQPIKNVIWYPLPGYLIFSQKTGPDKNSLMVIELDSRDYRQTIKLLETEKIDNLAIDSKGENLFFTAKIGNQAGLYSLNIH